MPRAADYCSLGRKMQVREGWHLPSSALPSCLGFILCECRRSNEEGLCTDGPRASVHCPRAAAGLQPDPCLPACQSDKVTVWPAGQEGQRAVTRAGSPLLGLLCRAEHGLCHSPSCGSFSLVGKHKVLIGARNNTDRHFCAFIGFRKSG